MTWNWYYLSAIPLAWFVQLTLHEISHAVAGLLYEGRLCLGIYPYPHYYQGVFYFARCSLGGATTESSEAPRHIAPVFGGIWWAIMCFVLTFVCQTWFFTIFGVMGLLETPWFYWGLLFGSPQCDGKRYLKAKRKM